jgi:hypothetical protein
MQIAGFEDVVRGTGSLAVPHYHPRQSCACRVLVVDDDEIVRASLSTLTGDRVRRSICPRRE